MSPERRKRRGREGSAKELREASQRFARSRCRVTTPRRGARVVFALKRRLAEKRENLGYFAISREHDLMAEFRAFYCVVSCTFAVSSIVKAKMGVKYEYRPTKARRNVSQTTVELRITRGASQIEKHAHGACTDQAFISTKLRNSSHACPLTHMCLWKKNEERKECFVDSVVTRHV